MIHPTFIRPHLKPREGEVSLHAVRQVDETGHVKMGQPCAPDAEPGHADVRDVLEGCHAEVGEQGALLAEARDPGVGNLVVVVADITFQLL